MDTYSIGTIIKARNVGVTREKVIYEFILQKTGENWLCLKRTGGGKDYDMYVGKEYPLWGWVISEKEIIVLKTPEFKNSAYNKLYE